MKNIGIFCSSSSQIDPKYLNEGRAIGEAIGKAGKTMVYGGTDFGLMKAVADAAHETGGRLVGVVPKLLEERGRAHTSLDEKILVDDLSERKRVMVERSDILIVLPGGIGPLDEAFSTLAGYTLGYHHKPTYFYDMQGFWSPLVVFMRRLGRDGFVKPEGKESWHVIATHAELLRIIAEI